MAQLIFRKPGEPHTKRVAPIYIFYRKAMYISIVINIVTLGCLICHYFLDHN